MIESSTKTSSLRAKQATIATIPKFTIILPTYRRPDVLRTCFEYLKRLSVGKNDVEILVYDNGAPEGSQHITDEFSDELQLTYTLNEPGHGLGYSICRGVSNATGNIIIELNDDALVPEDFLERIGAIFESDPNIGVVGVRAIEQEYDSDSRGIGIIDLDSAEVVGNFDRTTKRLIDVEHVYGFCYAYRRDLVEAGGTHDRILLAQDFSSGNRIETDHCLTAKAMGYRVVYDGSIGVQHLAKPRPDLDETSLRWKHNHWRNTLYLYLKHFGWFGRNSVALKFACKDIGLLSLLRRPNKTNWLYFWTGTKARINAVFYWTKLQRLKLRRIDRTSRIERTNQA